MLPRPPFLSDLTPELELAAFERLKPRLAALWHDVSADTDAPATSVVVPSFTLDNEELAKITGVSHYEERLLFLLIRLRNPSKRVVYVTSQPVHPLTLDYYLHLLPGVPASHARARLTMLCAYDASPRPLTQKVLERPRLIQRIRHAIVDPETAYLTVFNATPLERKLAVLLGIPLNGLDPALAHLGSKSGGRRVFMEAGVDRPDGVEDVKTPQDAARALGELKERHPAMRRAILKLNESFSGEGNAVVHCADAPGQGDWRRAIDDAVMPVPTETPERYFEKLGRMGGVLEEFIEAADKRSPSAQFRTAPDGAVVDVSTHDQILGGDTGQIYLGCTFPARKEYRQQIRESGRRVAEVLSRHGVVSRFGVDFLAWRNGPDEAWRTVALEINLRVVGTTHPFLALRLLTGGELDPATGSFYGPSGRAKHYRATDNLTSEIYRGILPEDLVDIVSMNGLHYDHRTESGVLFHMIGAVSEFGKLGLTVIGNDDEEVETLYQRTIDVLRVESTIGHLPSGFDWPAGGPSGSG